MNEQKFTEYERLMLTIALQTLTQAALTATATMHLADVPEHLILQNGDVVDELVLEINGTLA